MDCVDCAVNCSSKFGSLPAHAPLYFAHISSGTHDFEAWSHSTTSTYHPHS